MVLDGQASERGPPQPRNAGRMAGTQRCEVCDDTNASIRCQECRRNTCEECDEILHLVDANKSHNRVPLFPTRGSQSHNASYASSRNLSPRNSARWSKNDEDLQSFMPRVEASADIDRQIRDLNIGSASTKVEPFSFASRPADPAPQSKFTSSDSFASRPAAHTPQHSTNGQTTHTTSSRPDQMQAQRPAIVPELQSHNAPERSSGIYSAQRTYTAPESLVSKPKPIPQATPVAQYNPLAKASQQPTSQQLYAPIQQSSQHRAPTEESSHSRSNVPSERMLSQPAQPAQPAQQHTSRFQHMANHQAPSTQAPSQSSSLSNPSKQPLQSYGQSSSLSSSQHNYSGISTPSQYALSGARSHAHSGAATPTVPSINAAQNFNATGGAIPLSRWQDRQSNGIGQQQHHTAQQSQPQQETPISRSSLDSKQAYLQHMQVLEQHRAVEAHQRMTAYSRQQQYGQPSNQAQQGSGYPQMQMGHMTPSMRHTVGHSMGHHSMGNATPSMGHHSMGNATPSLGHHQMGNATPSLGHHQMGNATPSLGHHQMGNATPSMGHAMGYHTMGNATPSMGQNMGHMTPSYGYSNSVPYGGGASYSQPSQDQRYRFPSQAIVAQAGPNVVTWPHQMRQQQQQQQQQPYHQQPPHAPQHLSHAAASHDAMHARQYQSAYAAPSYAQARGYHEPKTPPPERTAVVYATAGAPRQAYTEPRTPYNEPRSPAGEPVGWPDSYHALAYATAPRSAIPSPGHVMPQRAQPYHAYASQSVHQQPGMQPMQGSSYSTPSTLMHAKQPSPVDEAETRVRNLIADTERMLAGLSSYS